MMMASSSNGVSVSCCAGASAAAARVAHQGAVTVINVGGVEAADGSHILDGQNIKYYQTCNGAIVPKEEPNLDDDGSDGEVSKIDFTGVNLRTKKQPEPERPMSWEGELSDAEMSSQDSTTPVVSSGGGGDDASMEGVQVTSNASAPSPAPQGAMDKIQHTHLSQQSSLEPGSGLRGKGPSGSDLPLLVDKLLGNGSCYVATPSQSPVLPVRHPHPMGKPGVPPTPSPDSAIHSAYSYSSPAQSPVTSRHGSSHGLPSSGFSSPYTPSLSRNNSDASQYGGSQHSSCYSYSSVSPTQFSPTHSPIQSRHHPPTGSPLHVLYGMPVPRSSTTGNHLPSASNVGHLDEASDTNDERDSGHGGDDKMCELVQHSAIAAPPGISRQQLINSPCPICEDKISGFHYGIFSCESCKGFFKRTVQNRKNYVCLRGSACPVSISTRKKCPACRFDKCLKMGMKLEAIREDRTRGGRSTYQCSYTLPTALLGNSSGGQNHGNSSGDLLGLPTQRTTQMPSADPHVKLEVADVGASAGAGLATPPISHLGAPQPPLNSGGWPSDKPAVPSLLQEIMDVEHLWHSSEQQRPSEERSSYTSINPDGSNPDFLSNLCNIADHRLYRLVKWCKSLPLFKNISIDDQISLLINAWCELLLFSCCFRSMSTSGEIRVSLGKSITLAQARHYGLGPCIERMLNFTEHLRRLRVDKYEYVAMKVIVLLTSDASDLRESEKVRASQEKALEALQHYTIAHYPELPSKFGELLLRIPELQRTCQVGKEMLSIKNKDGEGPSFNLLMELLRGDH